MSKASGVIAGEEQIVQSLMQEMSSLSLHEIVSKAVAEGARWGAREALRALAQQLLDAPPGTIVVAAPAASEQPAASKSGKNGVAATAAAELATSASKSAKTVNVSAAPRTLVGVDGSAKKEPIACPSPGCKKPGVRQYQNFCREHFHALTPEKRKELRARQAQANKPPPKLVVKCPVPDCTNTGVRPLHNFCQAHYSSLPEGKRFELRAKQLARTRKQRKQALQKTQQAG